MDFRGFGGTPKDESGFVDPLRCVFDVVSVLNWIHNREQQNLSANAGELALLSEDGRGEKEERKEKKEEETKKVGLRPALLGWSQGALIAQLVAQRHPEAISKLIL